MENENYTIQPDALTQQLETERVNLNPIDNSMPFTPVEDMFPPIPGEDLPDDIKSLMDGYTKQINGMSPGVNANLYRQPLTASRSGLATDTFGAPPKDVSIMDKLTYDLENPAAPTDFGVSPTFANIKAVEFDRAYESNAFLELGFTPFSNNEASYNTNMTEWDGFTRGFEQFGNLFGSAFFSQTRSIADLFDGDSYLETADFEGSSMMEDAMRIGGNRGGGVQGFLGNQGLNFAYTAGIIASIAVEEVAIAAGSAALATTGVGAPAAGVGLVAGTIKNLAKLKDIYKVYNITNNLKRSSQFIKSVAKIKNAKDFYKVARGAGGASALFLAPEITYAIRNWKTTGNTAQNLWNIGKNTHLFGAFYRHTRGINAAMSEAKMEAGLVHDTVIQNGMKYAESENGINAGPSAKQEAEMITAANDASYKTILSNFGVIYLSNQIVLKNALGGWQRRVATSNPRKYAKGLSEFGLKSKNPIKAFKQTVKAAYNIGGWKGAAKASAAGSLRYASANFAEGLQEISQEAISSGIGGYYSSILRDPLVGGPTTLNGYMKQGIGEQFSKQGLETFAGGFLMGGLAGPYQSILFQGMPSLLKRTGLSGKFGGQTAEQFKNYRAQKEAILVADVAQMNVDAQSFKKSGVYVLSEQELNLTLQKQTAGLQNTAIALNEKKDFEDNRNFTDFNAINSKYENGTIKFYREDLKNYLNLSDTELVEAFSEKDTGRNATSLRKQINSQIKKIDNYGKLYTSKLDKAFPRLEDPSIYARNTREYYSAFFAKKSQDHAKMLYIFSNESFMNAVTRTNDISQSLQTEPIFAKMQSTDISVLLNPSTIATELKMLNNEIAGMKGVEQDKDLIKNKVQRRDALKEFQKVLTDPKNVTAKGSYNRRKISALKPSYRKYLNVLAGQNNDFVNQDEVDNSLQKIVDYSTLQEEAAGFNKSVEMLLNTGKRQEIIDRTEEYFKYLFKNGKSLNKKIVSNYIASVEKNNLINGLAEQDIFIDPVQLKAFMETNDVSVLTDFYTDGRLLSETQMDFQTKEVLQILKEDEEKVLFKDNIIEAYIQLTTPKVVVEDKAVDDAIVEKTEQDINKSLADQGITVDIGDSSNSNILQEILKKQYRVYKANTAAEVLDFTEWLDSFEALNIKTGFDAIKKVWGNGYDDVVTQKGQQIDIKRVPTIKELESEKGFQRFIDSRVAQESPIINAELAKLGLDIELYTTPSLTIAELENIAYDGVMFKVQKVEDRSDKKNVYYVIVDNQGKPLSKSALSILNPPGSSIIKQGSYNDLSKAKLDVAILDREFSDGNVFKFDGLELSKGLSVFDKNTEIEYRVNSNAKTAASGYVQLVPIDQWSNDYQGRQEAQIDPEIETDFSSRYSVEKIVFDILPSSVARVKIENPIKIYAKNNKNESDQSAQARLDFITSAVTSEQLLDNFSLVIEPNSAIPYEVPWDLGGKANKYIFRKQEALTLAIVVKPELLASLNQKLVDANLEKLDAGNDGVIGFMPNDSIVFKRGKKVVLPGSMSESFFENVMLVPKGRSISKAYEITQNNFANQRAILNIAQDIMSQSKNMPVELTFRELNNIDENVDISFKQFAGYPNYPVKGEGQEQYKLSQLPYGANNAGDTIIYDVTRDKGGYALGQPAVISNLNKDDRKALEATVKAELVKNGLWDKMMGNGKAYSERYQYVVKTPNGTYTLATASSLKQTTEDISYVLNLMSVRATKTREENLKPGSTDAIDKSFNDVWNSDNKKLFRINMMPGYNMNFNVSPEGNIRAGYFYTDRDKKITNLGKPQQLYAADQKKGSLLDQLNVLLEKLNSQQAVVDAKVNVSADKFVVNVELDSTLDEMLDNLATKLKPSIRRGSFMYASTNGAVVAANAEKPIILSMPDSADQTPKMSAVEKMAVAEQMNAANAGITDAEFKLFTDSGSVTPEVISAISEKIMSGQELSTREQAVRNSPVVAKQVEEFLKASLSETQKGSIDLTALAATPLDILNNELKKIETSVISEFGPREKRKRLKENKVYQKLLKKRQDILNKTGNKILPARLSSKDVEDLDIFLEWANKNLPEYIDVADIQTLGNNLKVGGVRVGAFAVNLNDLAGGLAVGGTIYTGATNSFRYHEAFHGVYRMMLSPEQQKRLLGIAKIESRAKLRTEGKSFTSELNKLRNSADTYTNMSKQELEDTYYEEYMADQFEAFKINPKNTKTDGEIKSFFNRLLDWIKNVFDRLSGNTLNALYQDIDSGKYRNSSIAVNEFTNNYSTDIVIANALLPYATNQVNQKTGKLFLESEVANSLVNSMAANYIQRRSSPEYSKLSVDERLEGIINDFEWLYNIDNPDNAKYVNSTDPIDIKKVERLERITDAINFDNIEGQVSPIKKSITDILDIIDVIKQEEQDNADDYESQDGLRNVTQYGKEAYMNGGFTSMSTFMRAYLSTTSMEQSDWLGNTELVNGEKLIVPIDVYNTYNGLTKAVKGIEDPLKILQAMYIFSDSNPSTKAAVKRMFNDMGLNYGADISEMTLPSGENVNLILFNQIKTAFTNFRIEWLFQERDSEGGLRIYSAAERDDVNSQTDSWSEAYTSLMQMWELNPSKRFEASQTLIDIANDNFKKQDTKITDAVSKSRSKEYAQRIFDQTGIKLSPLYIEFSITSSRNKTPNQELLASFNPEALPIEYDDLYFMSEIIKNDNDLYDEDAGARTKLKKLAVNNAIFDESIGLTTFTNTNGDLVNAHQKPTYHLRKVNSLNNNDTLTQMRDDNYLQGNHLLESPFFENMSDNNKLEIIRVSGVKVTKKFETEVNLDADLKSILSTTEYGSFTPSEFVLNMINNYTIDFNTKNGKLKNPIIITNPQGNEAVAAKAPILIRVLESSNTGDLTSLPVVKTVNANGEITTEMLDATSKFVEREYNRIVREAPQSDQRTTDDLIGYNVSDNDGRARAYEMVNSIQLLSNNLAESLERIALQDDAPSFQQALADSGYTKTKWEAFIKEKLNAKFNKFNDLIDTLNIRDEISDNVSKGLVRDKKNNLYVNATKSAESLNLRAGLEHNLRQIFFNNFINTKAINELLLGDQARLFKDAKDAIKRAKGQNAAIDSVYTPLSDPSKGVNHETDNIKLLAFEDPIVNSSITGESIDKADAQMYLTTKAFRHFWFGLGKLSDAQAAIIDKIEQGIPLTKDEVFGINGNTGLIAENGMLNSKKFVHFDGGSYIKMSGFVLTPELTSIDTGERVTGEDGITQEVVWKANPLRVELHNLRMKMEQLEKTDNSVSISAPVSAIKMLKQNVVSYADATTGESVDNESIIISGKDFGLQVVNPSNKNEITELTQIKAIITSEQKDDLRIPSMGNKTIKQIKVDYNNAIKKRITLKYKGSRNLVYTFEGLQNELYISRDSGKLTPNLTMFLKYATNSLKASKSSSNLLEFFSLDPETSQPKYELDNPIAIAKAEQLFLSYFSKGVFSEKIAGHGLSLVSSSGMNVYRRVFSVEKNKQGEVIPGRSEVIRDRVARNILGKKFTDEVGDRKIEQLLKYTQEGVNIPSEGIVVVDRLRMGLKEYDAKGQETGLTYSESMMPSHFPEVLELIERGGNKAIPDAVSKMFSVRIPSQDNHSSMNVKMVDFLPVYYGSSAMFADELVEVSGADFDIDKVYTQIKEWYEENGNFYEYGDTPARQFKDYRTYIDSKIYKNSIYSQALQSYNIQGSRIEDSFEDGDMLELGYKYDDSVKALLRLGLPVTKKQYEDYIDKYNSEPYVAPYNNQILDQRFALAGNTGVKDISFTPATLDAVKAAYDYMELKVPNYVESVSQTDIDIDDMYGMTTAFTNNKGAAIGKAVSPNLYLSLLTEYGIQLPNNLSLSIFGETYTGFDVLEHKNGKRKQDTISSIITMLTDNSKENYVSKLGMHPNVVGLVTNMVALGIPLNEAVLVSNTEVMRDIFSKAATKKDKFDAGVKGLIKEQLQELRKKLKLEKGSRSNNSLTEEVLINATELNSSDITSQEKFDILSFMDKVAEITEFTGKMNSMTALSSGLGKDFSDIQKTEETIQDLLSESALLDIKPIMNGSWIKANVDIHKIIAEELIPVTFISGTKAFNDMYSKLALSMNTQNNSFDSTVEKRVRKDLLSYLTIKAYMNNANDTGTLSNKLIYDNLDFSIYNIVDRLKVADNNNFFLNSFITQVPFNNRNNSTGINLVKANTWRKLNKFQKIDLQTSFAKLYGNPATQADAMSIVNYLMVKDGLQLAEGTLLEAISPFVLNEYLDQIPSIKKTLLDDSNYVETFGTSKENLMEEFVDGYLTSNVSQPLVKELIIKVGPLGTTQNIKGYKFNLSENTLTYKGDERFEEFIRIADNTSLQNSYTTYRTFKKSKETDVWSPVVTMGSNYQNGMGFIFGDRDTYPQIKAKVKNKTIFNEDTNDYSQMGIDTDNINVDDLNVDDYNSIVKGLQNYNANIDVTEDSIDFDIDDFVPQESSDIINEAEGVLEAEANAVPVSQEGMQTILDFAGELEDNYPVLTNFWDTNIQPGFTSAKTSLMMEALKDNKIVSLEDLIALYNNKTTQWKSEQEMIEDIKKCNF